MKFATKIHRLSSSALLLVVIGSVSGNPWLPACNAKSSSLTKRPSTGQTTRGQMANPVMKSRQAVRQVVIPGWWRDEWTRRQVAMRTERWLLAKERQTDSKAMWNPRSPQALAFRHALITSHGGTVPSYQPPRSQRANPASITTTNTKSVNAKCRSQIKTSR